MPGLRRDTIAKGSDFIKMLADLGVVPRSTRSVYIRADYDGVVAVESNYLLTGIDDVDLELGLCSVMGKQRDG